MTIPNRTVADGGTLKSGHVILILTLDDESMTDHHHHHHHHHFISSKTKDIAMQTKDMDVEQDTPGSDDLLRWPLRKKEYGNTQIHKM